MKRTTIKLSDDLDALLRQEAQRHNLTVSDLTRDAIASHVQWGAPRTLLAAKAGRGGQADVSERIEQIPRKRWTPPWSSRRSA